jgi:hypothetical protein
MATLPTLTESRNGAAAPSRGDGLPRLMRQTTRHHLSPAARPGMNDQEDRPRHLRRYTETYLGPKGRLNPYDRVGLWAVAFHLLLMVAIFCLLLPRG